MFKFFENDPFFRIDPEHQMEQMDDFWGFGPQFMHPMIPPMIRGFDEPPINRHGSNTIARHQFNDMGDPFSMVHSMMRNMQDRMMINTQQFTDQAFNDKDTFCYSHSSVRSYSDDGTGKPKMFQAISETKKGPGGVKESKRAVRDSVSGKEKMAIGRHLDDKSHVLTRERNMNTGDIHENQDFLNMAEEEREAFDADWQKRSSFFGNPFQQRMLSHPSNRRSNKTALLDVDPSLRNDI